jgi:hypothetical protein
MKRLAIAFGFSCAVAVCFGIGAAQAADSAAAERATQRLFEAIRANDLGAVQASLAAGANPEATDRWGIKATDLAIDKGYFRIAQVLAAARASGRASAAAAAPAEARAASAKMEAGKALAEPAGKPVTAAARPASPPTTSAAAASPAATQKPATTRAGSVWPAGVPNPFDPTMPPPRSQLAASGGADGLVAQ